MKSLRYCCLSVAIERIKVSEAHLARKEALGGLGNCIAASAEEHVGALHHMVRRRCDRAQAGRGNGHHA